MENANAKRTLSTILTDATLAIKKLLDAWIVITSQNVLSVIQNTSLCLTITKSVNAILIIFLLALSAKNALMASSTANSALLSRTRSNVQSAKKDFSPQTTRIPVSTAKNWLSVVSTVSTLPLVSSAMVPNILSSTKTRPNAFATPVSSYKIETVSIALNRLKDVLTATKMAQNAQSVIPKHILH